MAFGSWKKRWFNLGMPGKKCRIVPFYQGMFREQRVVRKRISFLGRGNCVKKHGALGRAGGPVLFPSHEKQIQQMNLRLSRVQEWTHQIG